jgi:kynurenine formamidase
VDVPRHFIENGKSISDLSAEEWIFRFPLIHDVQVRNRDLITTKMLSNIEKQEKTDILLLRTGLEKERYRESYWKDGPGLAPELAEFFIQCFPQLRAVGIDFISISSLAHREQGRKAHREFLKRDILLFEDMSLKHVLSGNSLKKVIALPLRFLSGDGAPCSVIAHVLE